jgi:SEC-C motif-containing protein
MTAFGGGSGGDACPCGSTKPYDSCCGPLHRGESLAQSAEQLMRSRYAAHARRLDGYLLATWHPSTRPAALDLDPGLLWQRLEVLGVVGGAAGESEGEVEFRAHYRHHRTSGELHERSRFVRRGGRWFYLDGDLA